jgi:hypothetical protein
MSSSVLVEYRSGLLAIRQQILEFLGHPIKAVQATSATKNLDLALIGHRAPRQERSDLIRHFRFTPATIPLLRLQDERIVYSRRRQAQETQNLSLSGTTRRTPLASRTMPATLAARSFRLLRSTSKQLPI